MNLTVKEVAELLNISDRAVRKNCDSGKYDCVYVNGRGGNGGKNILISLESLPQEAQDRYNGVEKEPELLIERYSLTQIKGAEYKASIVLEFSVPEYRRKNSYRILTHATAKTSQTNCYTNGRRSTRTAV